MSKEISSENKGQWVVIDFVQAKAHDRPELALGWLGAT
jgi:hypothetical protein